MSGWGEPILGESYVIQVGPDRWMREQAVKSSIVGGSPLSWRGAPRRGHPRMSKYDRRVGVDCRSRLRLLRNDSRLLGGIVTLR